MAGERTAVAAMGPPGTGSLGDRLRAARQRRFVGRSGELELFRRALSSPYDSFTVLFVYGPGGVGKTSLLDMLAGAAIAGREDAGTAGRAARSALSGTRAGGDRRR